MHKCINVLALLCFASLSGLLKGSNQFKVQVGKSLGARDKQIISLIRFKCQFKAFLVLVCLSQSVWPFKRKLFKSFLRVVLCCARYFAKRKMGYFCFYFLTWPQLGVIGVLICTQQLYDFVSAMGSLDNITRFYHTDAVECDVFW